FENGQYHICVNGPNGFFREFKGKRTDPALMISFEYEHAKSFIKKLTGNVAVLCKVFQAGRPYKIIITDNAYKNKPVEKDLSSDNPEQHIILNLSKSHYWYDFSIRLKGLDDFKRRYAGHVETGKDSFTDPAMGGEFV
ncbi:MAG: phosphocholine-specific phospholipase C, partial [Chitinophagaceae bacterium]